MIHLSIQIPSLNYRLHQINCHLICTLISLCNPYNGQAEVTVSIDGVAVQEPKGKKILHQFPLHQISYCADDKAEKKFFSFIAKDGDVHRCFVFSSEKLVRA